MIPIVWVLLLSGAVNLWAQNSKEFVFAARRTGIAEVIDADSLETVAQIHVDFHVERFSATADGSKLNFEGYTTGAGCCKHYAIDAATSKVEEFKIPWDEENYGSCLISPDGRWCFKTKSFRGPALKIVDLQGSEPPRELAPPDLTTEVRGILVAGRYYLYGHRPADPGGRIWPVEPGTIILTAGIAVATFGETPNCVRLLPSDRSLLVAGERLYIYEPFGGKADRTGGWCQNIPGGAWLLDPNSGALSNPIGAEFHFNKLVSDRAGTAIYGVVPGKGLFRGPVQLVKFNSDGKLVKSRNFEPGVLQISMGQLTNPPAGDVRVRIQR